MLAVDESTGENQESGNGAEGKPAGKVDCGQIHESGQLWHSTQKCYNPILYFLVRYSQGVATQQSCSLSNCCIKSAERRARENLSEKILIAIINDYSYMGITSEHAYS